MGGLVATTAYLDAKLHISKDLRFLLRISREEQNLLAASTLLPSFDLPAPSPPYPQLLTA